MDYPTDQNQYYQYYSSYQQPTTATTIDPSHQGQPYDQSYYDYAGQAYYNSYQHQLRPANEQPSSVSSYYSHQDYSNSYQYQCQPQSGSTSQQAIALNPTQNAESQYSALYPYVSFGVNRQSQQPSRGGRGGGRRGGKPFRGGARGRGESAARGRGRGQISRRPLPPNSGLTLTPSSSLSHAQEPLSFPSKQPLRAVYCDLCKIDCSTAENLEIHKSGKKHKKNLQAQESLKNHANNTINEQQNARIQGSESKPEESNVQTVGAFGSQEATVHMENSNLCPVGTDGIKSEPEKQKIAEEKPEMSSVVNCAENPSPVADDGNKDESENGINPAETASSAAFSAGKPRWSNNNNTRTGFQGHGRGLKRSLRGSRGGRGGRGGKFLRSDDGSRRLVEPPKPKEAIPYICELCHVKCESQVVFNSHLAGKKHLGNVKRFHENLAATGSSSSSTVIPQLNINPQGMADPQVILAQLLNVILQQAQTQQAQTPEHAALLAQAQSLITPLLPKSEAASGPIYGIPLIAGAENLQIPAKPESEAASNGENCPKTADEASMPEKNEVGCSEDEVQVAAATENAEEVTN